MSNYNKSNIEKYLKFQKQNLGNSNCQCACCHKSMIISEAQLAFPYWEKKIGKYGEYHEDIYAYRVCSQCKKKIEQKQSINEVKTDNRLKYLGLAAIIWGCVLGMGLLSTFVLIGTDNSKVADEISPFLGLWLLLPIPIMIIGIIGVVGYVYIYEPIKSKLIPNDGIDFDEALRLNAVHWYTK